MTLQPFANGALGTAENGRIVMCSQDLSQEKGTASIVV